MSLIEADDLAKSYGHVTAVNGLSLKVEKGNVMGLIGPNGAGKTTTIKIVLGLLRQDRGQVRVFGQDPWNNPDIRRKIGVIYERAYFPSHHRVLDYLKATCRIYGKPESKAMEALRRTRLQDAHRRNVKDLSAGMLQKFAIAHSLINEPEFIIADEPTSNLDPEARGDVLDLILRLHKDEGVSFLISSHILPELSRVCESVAIINRGHVWASGNLEELSVKLGAKTTRVTTDKPGILAEEIRKFSYVSRVEADSRSVAVGVNPGEEQRLYEDVPKLAKKVEARINGIDSGTASLEELFRLAVKSDREEQ